MRAVLLALLLVGCTAPAHAERPSCVTPLPYTGGPIVGYGRPGVMHGSKQVARTTPAQSLSVCAAVRQDVRQA